MLELPIENNKHLNFKWRGQGRGADSFVLWINAIWVQFLNNFVADCSYYTVTQQKEIWQQELYWLTFTLSLQNLFMVYIMAF